MVALSRNLCILSDTAPQLKPALTPKQARFVAEYLVDSGMRPTDAVDNLRDGALADVVSRGDIALLLPPDPIQRSNNRNVGIGQLGVRVLGTDGVPLCTHLRGVASLENHVGVIVSACPAKQMARTNAAAIIAVMTDARGRGAMSKREGHAVREQGFINAALRSMKASIAHRINRALPLPAFGSFVYKFPEAYGVDEVFTHA